MLQIGVIQLDPTRRLVKLRGQAVRMNARGFDLLECLVQAGGEVVSKEALIERVWPGLVVEEANLQVQISTVRKALGADRELIETVARQGYRFAVNLVIDASGVTFSPTTGIPVTNLPHPVSALIGRDRVIDEVSALLSARRVVTLTGPGGIGKTRVALEAGHRAIAHYPAGVWFVDLSSIHSPELVAGRVASALGARVDHYAHGYRAIADLIGDDRLLLILDNCEHLINELAELATTLIRFAPQMRILATSREALVVEGELIYQVPSLGFDRAMSAGDEASSAVALFQSRVSALGLDVPNDEHHVEQIRTLCARLDGIPLVIEIAAGWLTVVGLDALLERIDDQLPLQMTGNRSLAPRHVTLGATLDWSFNLLEEDEREIACLCAVFAGGFTLDAALALCAPKFASARAVSLLSSVARKSLICVDLDELGTRYRILETTRVYLRDKLRERGGWDAVVRRHVDYFLGFFKDAAEDPGPELRIRHLQTYLRETDNARAAIEWAYSQPGTSVLGAKLAARMMYPMFNASMIQECSRLAERALQVNKDHVLGDRVLEMELLGMRAAAISYTIGPTDEVASLWGRALSLAEYCGDVVTGARALWGLWTQRLYAGLPRESLRFANFYAGYDSTDRTAHEMHAHRLIGTSMHFAGDQNVAWDRLDHVARQFDYSVHHIPMIGSRFDQRRAAQVTLTRVNLLKGKLSTALSDVALITSDYALGVAPPMLRCYALIDMAIPVSMILHQWELARRYCDELKEVLSAHPLSIWAACNACFSDIIEMHLRRSTQKRVQLETHIDRLQQMRFLVHLSLIECLCAQRRYDEGDYAEALATIERAYSDCIARDEAWCLPEILRLRAECVLRLNGTEALAPAERDFVEGLVMARDQGAVLWELRLAKSYAGFLVSQARATEATLILRQAYDRFDEGFELPDLVAAKVMLQALQSETM